MRLLSEGYCKLQRVASHTCIHRAQPARSPTDGWDFPKLGIRGLQNFMKLRTRHRFNDRLTADLGVDINALNQAIIPRAALSYQVPPDLIPCPVVLFTTQLSAAVRVFRRRIMQHRSIPAFRSRSQDRLFEGAMNISAETRRHIGSVTAPSLRVLCCRPLRS